MMPDAGNDTRNDARTDARNDARNDARREQFLTPRNSRRPLVAGVVLAVALAAALYVLLGTSLLRGSSGGAPGQPVAAPRTYVGRVVQAQAFKPEIAQGQARVSLADVDRLNIVEFALTGSRGVPVPVMAYITSSGRLFVGRSLCACGGNHFFLAGEALVCGSCRSTYSIEEQKFLSGAVSAGRTPPARIKFVVENGMIVIDAKDI